ncbi:MAG: hypothetical protein DCC71_12155 [Proteobacteria bacterium]|nr:MAG: hypothetical protein DCC71_12155 [Pseudomonadota bacterium]
MKFEIAALGALHRAATGSAIRYERERPAGVPTFSALSRAARKDSRVRRPVDLAEAAAAARRDGVSAAEAIGLVLLVASIEPGDDASTWLAAVEEFRRLAEEARPVNQKESA